MFHIFYVNLSYTQSGKFVNFNNKLDTIDCGAVDMIKELREILHGKYDIVSFSNDEINDIFVSLCCN